MVHVYTVSHYLIERHVTDMLAYHRFPSPPAGQSPRPDGVHPRWQQRLPLVRHRVQPQIGQHVDEAGQGWNA